MYDTTTKELYYVKKNFKAITKLQIYVVMNPIGRFQQHNK